MSVYWKLSLPEQVGVAALAAVEDAGVEEEVSLDVATSCELGELLAEPISELSLELDEALALLVVTELELCCELYATAIVEDAAELELLSLDESEDVILSVEAVGEEGGLLADDETSDVFEASVSVVLDESSVVLGESSEVVDKISEVLDDSSAVVEVSVSVVMVSVVLDDSSDVFEASVSVVLVESSVVLEASVSVVLVE